MEVSVAPGGADTLLPAIGARTDWALGALAAVLAMAAAAAALLVSPRYFFTDDYATQFTPAFREIARLLAQGHFPLITDRVWHGGALLQEYQYAVFNPVSMILYMATGQVDDLASAAAIFSLVHIAVLAAGAYFACRVLGAARRHAFLAAVLTPLSSWIFFWGAIDWIPALVSMAWLVWAWGFLTLTFRRPAFAPAAAVAVAMTLLSGWPFANLALLISVAVAAEVFLAAGAPWRLHSAAWVAFAVFAGGLLAAPAILPLQLYVASVHRPSIIGGMATDLAGLLEVGMPFYQTRWGLFHDLSQLDRQPVVFVAWFAPLVLATTNWPRLAARKPIWIVLGSAAAFAALSMISHILQFRWMFRLLPYYQFAILLLVALALTDADVSGRRWRLSVLAAVIAAEVWLAFCQSGSPALVYLAVGCVIGVFAWISTRFETRRDVRWTAFALATSIIAFWLAAWSIGSGGYPKSPNAWRPPTKTASPLRVSAAGQTRYAIVPQLAGPPDPGMAFWSTYGFGNTVLNRPGTSIIGYSSMVSRPAARLQCGQNIGQDCDDVITHVTARVGPTGRSLIDLMSIDEVLVQRPVDARAFEAWAGAGWSQVRGPAGEWRFDRLRPIGLVSWASPGATARIVSRQPARVIANVRNDAATPAMLVLARAWYPGWSARLNGALVLAHPLAGLLVSVDLPPRSHGRLEVSFWPSGLTVGLALAAIGAVLLALSALFRRRLDQLIGNAVESRSTSR